MTAMNHGVLAGSMKIFDLLDAQLDACAEKASLLIT